MLKQEAENILNDNFWDLVFETNNIMFWIDAENCIVTQYNRMLKEDSND